MVHAEGPTDFLRKVLLIFCGVLWIFFGPWYPEITRQKLQFAGQWIRQQQDREGVLKYPESCWDFRSFLLIQLFLLRLGRPK